MTRNISQTAGSTWAARTATGMVFLTLTDDDVGHPTGADLIAIRNAAGDMVAARLIGPVAGDVPESERWRIERRWRVDASGAPLATVAQEIELRAGSVQGHDWGALGLPEGLDSCVRPIDDAVTIDELTLAHASSGHRMLDRNPLLTMAPGDHVVVDGTAGTVVTIDRRKRMVEIARDGDVTVHDFDNVQVQEIT